MLEACPVCGLFRPVHRNTHPLCRSCWIERLRGNTPPNWKGGRKRDGHGYIMTYLPNNDFFAAMGVKHITSRGVYVREHRLVIARNLGRCLHSWEIVHHKNGIRDDNRLENLQLVSDMGHKQITLLENCIKRLEARIMLLEAENIILRKRVHERHYERA